MKTIKRRRKENKTDYGKRFKLLKGGLPRIVFRKTNRYLVAQYIISSKAQDKVVLGIDSKNLIEYGWPKESGYNLKSIPDSYLLGYLIGKKIVIQKLKNPIADFGMMVSIHKSKIYAFLKGLIDSGIEMTYKKEIFPEEVRIKGEHLKNKIPFEKIKQKIEEIK